MAANTIPFRLQQQVRIRPDAPAYHVRTPSGWAPTTFRSFEEEVRRAGKSLIAMGLSPGATVSILGFNRPEWVILDVACMSIGGAPAGVYTTCSPEEVRYIVHHAESPVILVENHSQWEKVKHERENLPLLKHIVLMRGNDPIDDPLTLTWEQFLERGKDVPDGEFDARIEGLKPPALATLIYTSGTTGPPKGVMLSHHNVSWTAATARDMIGGRPDDRVLSYLPLSHIAEQMFSIHGAITTGYSIYFAESIDKVADNLKEVRPTVFFGVPRIWEKLYAGINDKLKQATGLRARLVDFARAAGKEALERKQEGQPITGTLALRYALARQLVLSKLKEAIGLADARVCVSGAAPIGLDVLEFFGSFDIPVLEVYGQSEDCGPTSFNRPDAFRLGTVGPAVPGVDVRIDPEDGEILVKGPNVFLGYYKEEAATRDSFTEDGWLRTGDLGTFDEKGFLRITGRKKDIIITAGGKNIAPRNIEEALKAHELIAEAVVIGDRRKFLTALITLDADAARKFAEARGLDPNGLHADMETRAEIQAVVDQVNQSLARVEQLKKFTILPRAFTIEDGELTPTLKIKRKIVNEHFSGEIEAMYQEPDAARAARE